MALWDGCIGKWALSGGVWTDSSGNGNNLSVSGTPTQTAGHGGTANAAANLQGSHYLFKTDTAQLSVTGPMSVFGWVYFTITTSAKGLITKSNATSNQRSFILQIDATTNKLHGYLYSNGSTGANAASTNGVPVGAFAHVGMVYDGVDTRTYINGVLDGAPTPYTLGIFDSSAPFAIGAYNTNSTPVYSSSNIDDVAYWNRALSAAEVAELYALPDDFVIPPNIATGAGTLDAPVGAGSADISNLATGTGTLDAPVGSGSATVPNIATGAGTLDAPTGSGSATLDGVIAATGAGTLDAPVGAGSATLSNIATGTGTLDAPVGAGSATIAQQVDETFALQLEDIAGAPLAGQTVWLEAMGAGLQFYDFTAKIFVANESASTRLQLVETATPGNYQAVADVTGWMGEITKRVWYLDSSNASTYTFASERTFYDNGIELTASEMARRLALIPVAPLLAADYIAPNNAGIAAIIAQADTLEASVAALPNAAQVVAAVFAKMISGLTFERAMQLVLAESTGSAHVANGVQTFLAPDGAPQFTAQSDGAGGRTNAIL